ncbi:glutaminyl-peptide cyclotransferase [Mesonia sediminis]|uniref:Glutaminyl-peptide cyclotransferase n=1 Tax=Mesonia sediminis TaxID=1703946 RepID=A0ABW5SD65_9FLAO
MKTFKNLTFILLATSLFSCSSSKKEEIAKMSIQVKAKNDLLQRDSPVKFTLNNPTDTSFDSIQLYYANKYLGSSKTNQIAAKLVAPLGKNQLKAEIYSAGEKYTIAQEIVLHNNKPPKIYTYKIKNKYPHDNLAFTQGLEFFKDTLYEGTGRNGFSSLRKVDYKTGKVLKKIELDKRYFGEGISILNDKVYQLTWHAGQGFIYDVNQLKKLGTFKYGTSKEGWGLCNDGENFYKSDGTAKIWKLDGKTLEELSYIQPVTHKSLSTRLNELEWVDGKIYANTWQKDGIAIINPENGAIEGLIDLRGLKKENGNAAQLNNEDLVLNGIAFNKKSNTLFVTGKHWDTLFEIEIEER